MNDYTVINILDLLEIIGDVRLNAVLSDFSCPQNKEIEHFIHNNAIDFAKKKSSITHLVFNDKAQFLAYFTLTHKVSNIKNSVLSKSNRKKLERYARLDHLIQVYSVSAYLIAQLGKNYGIKDKQTISGNELMDLTFNILKYVQHQIGGGVVFLECENNPILLNFYQNEHNHFRLFDERHSDAEHTTYLKLLRFF